MWAITPQQMIVCNMPVAKKLLKRLEDCLEYLESDDPGVQGSNHYDITIVKVKDAFKRCGIPVDDQYQEEDHTASWTNIVDVIQNEGYGRLKHEVLSLADDESDIYLQNLQSFIDDLKKEINEESGSIIGKLAYHAEVRRRIKANRWIMAISLPAARLLMATGAGGSTGYRMGEDIDLEKLSSMTRGEFLHRYSKDEIADRLYKTQHGLSQVAMAIPYKPAYKKIELYKSYGIVSLRWRTSACRHASGATRLFSSLAESVIASLGNRPLDDVIDNPLTRNLGLRVILAEGIENGTHLATDEVEERNLIVLERPLS